jgi:hypothetical protein
VGSAGSAAARACGRGECGALADRGEIGGDLAEKGVLDGFGAGADAEVKGALGGELVDLAAAVEVVPGAAGVAETGRLEAERERRGEEDAGVEGEGAWQRVLG